MSYQLILVGHKDGQTPAEDKYVARLLKDVVNELAKDGLTPTSALYTSPTVTLDLTQAEVTTDDNAVHPGIGVEPGDVEGGQVEYPDGTVELGKARGGSESIPPSVPSPTSTSNATAPAKKVGRPAKQAPAKRVAGRR